MPKPAKNLWDKIVAWDNLILAAKEASRNKRYHAEVLRFNANLEENLLHIQQRLLSGEWSPGPFREFDVYEPKLRHIHAPAFEDRVVHHALVQHIGQYFEKRFIDQSFACRVGKGTHAASTCLVSYLRSARSSYKEGKVFVLKADISKYFNSIDHKILIKILSRIIGDVNVLEVLSSIITKSDCIQGDKGLPLGALTSQLFANAYLDQLDHFIKNELRIKYYLRYMDDFVVLLDNKADLWELLAKIRYFLICRLKLYLNHKTRVFPANQGIDFVGYRHWFDHILPRKRNTRRAVLSFRKISRDYALGKIDLEFVRPRVASFCGMMKHCDADRTTESVLERLVLRRPHSNLPEN